MSLGGKDQIDSFSLSRLPKLATVFPLIAFKNNFKWFHKSGFNYDTSSSKQPLIVKSYL